jgi:exopolysaccharide biosynthesis polyprenyl glycosylphosphotransferase
MAGRRVSLTDQAVKNPTRAEFDALPATGLVPDEAVEWQSTIATEHGRRDYMVRRVLLLSDMGQIVAALSVAFAIVGVDRGLADLLWLAPFLLVWATLFGLYGLYTRDVKRIGQGALDDLPFLFHAMLVGTLLMWVYYRLIIPVHPLVMEEVGVFALVATGLILLMRFAVRRISSRALGPERVLLVGEAPVTATLVRKMRAHPEYALEPIGLIAREHEFGSASPLPVLGTLDDGDLKAAIELHRIERVIVAQEDVPDDLMLRILQECGELQMKVSVLPRGVETMGPSMEVDDIEGVTVLGLNPLVLPRSARAIKRGVDLLGAGVGLLLLSPVMALAALAIKLDSRGPVLFRQPRMGRRGRVFSLVKFRTMVSNAEALAEELMAASQDPNWLKLDHDPRITRVGGFLRLTSLDELPQLWNVLRGKMSLVGPRPLTALDHDQIEGWARIRLDLAPGITGLWQVLGRTNIPFEEMVKLDYVYVTNWSPWTDLKLLAYTIPAVVQRRGAN